MKKTVRLLSEMRGRVAFAAAALAAVVALVVVPLTSASSVDTRLEIGYNLQLFGPGIGPGGSAGTFVASGAVHDSGTVTGHNTITPIGNDGDGRIEGTITLVGQLGTITEEFQGLAGPLGALHTAAHGTFTILGGTGAYADLHADGTFLTVADFTANQAIRTDDGAAN
jgi:hypothetical protein